MKTKLTLTIIAFTLTACALPQPRVLQAPEGISKYQTAHDMLQCKGEARQIVVTKGIYNAIFGDMHIEQEQTQCMLGLGYK
jgi:hypothetical protein